MQNIMFQIFNAIKYIFGSNKVKKACERRWNDYDETKIDKKIKGTLAHDVYTERYFTFIRSLYKKKVFLALTFPLTTDTDNYVAQITVQCAYTIYNIYMYIHTKAFARFTDRCLSLSFSFILSLSLSLSTHTHTHTLSLSLSLSHTFSLPLFLLLSLCYQVETVFWSFSFRPYSFLFFYSFFLFVFLSFDIYLRVSSSLLFLLLK